MAIGTHATGGNVLVNTTQAGRIGFSVDFGSGVMPAGSAKELVRITFAVASTAPAGQTPLTFSDTPAVRETSNLIAEALQTSYENGLVTILVPTAANASISGRAVTANGKGIANVAIDLYDNTGEPVRRTRTNVFGYFKLLDLPAGSNYMVAATAKRYHFTQTSYTLALHDNIDGVIFVVDTPTPR